jgi:hypothetical protein
MAFLFRDGMLDLPGASPRIDKLLNTKYEKKMSNRYGSNMVHVPT